MLGNFGMAKHKCKSMLPSLQDEMIVTCECGIINELTYIGIIPEGDFEFNQDFCGDPETFEST